MQNAECRMQNFELTHHSAFCILHSYNPAMSEVPKKRVRLLWTLLGAMIVVGLVPLVVSHYFLIGINRDSLQTLEQKYLTRSAVTIRAARSSVSNGFAR